MGTIDEILILPGWTTLTEKWSIFLESLSKKGIKGEVFSIPGLTEAIDHPWNLNNYVKWLKDKVGDRRVILIGHSSGGRIAIAFAAKYPQNLKLLVLIDSAGIHHNELSLRLKRFLFKSLAKVGRKITSSENLRNLLYKLARESDYKNADTMQRQTMINLISQDLKPDLAKITVPTLIIWGENDNITPLSDGKLMHKLIKDSKLEIIKTGRHSPQFTNPDEVVDRINEHL